MFAILRMVIFILTVVFCEFYLLENLGDIPMGEIQNEIRSNLSELISLQVINSVSFWVWVKLS